LFLGEWDWIGAERRFQRALEINPDHPEAYLHYGGLMEPLGRLDPGLQLKQQALERDPTSALTLVLIAVSFWNQRRYNDTIAWVNRALDQDPTHLFAVAEQVCASPSCMPRSATSTLPSSIWIGHSTLAILGWSISQSHLRGTACEETHGSISV
jgi:tetratricopeptide (TPR) repeat protein